jgi:hypothetical protein
MSQNDLKNSLDENILQFKKILDRVGLIKEFLIFKVLFTFSIFFCVFLAKSQSN